MKKTASEKERSRYRYVLLAGLIGVFAAMTDHVQILNLPVPPLGHIGSVLYSSILAVGVFKHRAAYDLLAQLRVKLEALGELAAGITHEIRNPLTSIKEASELLGDELKGLNHQKCGEYITLITEEAERLNNILTSFQDFTRPIKANTESVFVNEVIRKTVKLSEINAWDIRIRQKLSPDLPMVQMDALLMKQVFLNLIRNATEACGTDGELRIKTEYASPYVKVGFLDSGPGISDEALNHIFEPFYTTKTTGMGVGLAISKRIIDAHGGRIEVRNVLPKGAEFSILLPVRG